jgi:tetratricopeptide (TPR) repeat protein
MATDHPVPTPAFSAAAESVVIRGSVLRELRQQTGLRLVDLAGHRGAVTRLSRLERRPAHRLAIPVLNELLRAMGIGIVFVGSDTWHAAVVDEAVTWYTRGNFRAVRRTVTALGLIVSPCPPETRLLAEVFAARSADGQIPARTAEIMHALSQRAERDLAWPAAAWAHLFESEAYEARADHDAALSSAMGAIGIPNTAQTVLPLLCLAAAAARAFARCGQPDDALLILEAVPVGLSYPFPAALLARAAALVQEVSGRGARALMCLEPAVEAAMTVPNPVLCAEIRQDLARLYARDGRADLASVERLRAAALCRRAGDAENALALIDATLGACW